MNTDTLHHVAASKSSWQQMFLMDGDGDQHSRNLSAATTRGLKKDICTQTRTYVYEELQVKTVCSTDTNCAESTQQASLPFGLALTSCNHKPPAAPATKRENQQLGLNPQD